MPSEEKGNRDAQDVNKTLEQITHATLELPEEGDSGCSMYIERFMPLRSQPVPIDQRYMRLAEYTRQRSTVNRPYGLDRAKGHTIRRLYRIVDDGKIFAERVKVRDFQPSQVIILIDYSGSMMTLVEGNYDSTFKTALDCAIQAAAGAAYGLAEGRCEVAVYGHTGDVVDDKDVLIYNFKGFREPIEYLPYRLDPSRENRLVHENRDGYALQYVSKKFTALNRKRLLIHISDGAPVAEGYSGEPANKHCKSVVDDIRQRGIEVLSISITEEASRVNNFIYGKKHNVYNEDPNVIEGVVRNLFL